MKNSTQTEKGTGTRAVNDLILIDGSITCKEVKVGRGSDAKTALEMLIK